MRAASAALADDVKVGISGDVAAKLGSLTLSDAPSAAPVPDTCLAHLRLLVAFEQLKVDIGHKDGLWNVWDNRASASGGSLDALAKLREKRWAVFLARAVDRYGEWWRSLGSSMLKETQMFEKNGERYERFTEGKPLAWTRNDLPPLDVLMVWHAHMLSPRLYLEDCIRYGYSGLWAAGIPWQLVNEAVKPDFEYDVEDGCKETWQRRTGCEWENALDPLHKVIPCLACSLKLHIPWTTCGLPHDYNGDERPGLAGEGYGDGQLSYTCGKCQFRMTHDALRLSRFRKDVESYTTCGEAMPGTILDVKTGLTKPVAKKTDDRLFPTFLINKDIFDDIDDELEQDEKNANGQHSMAIVRSLIDDILSKAAAASTGDKPRISAMSKKYTSTTMSRYTQTSEFASLDLVGATLRLGTFTEAMNKLGWVYMKGARAIMERHLAKYARFIKLVAESPGELAVATLDVDLAWHTHLLSPKNYLAYTLRKTGTLLDHPDKVDQDRLSAAFEWTCEAYWDKYDVPYSDCTCWYCESIRYLNDPDTLEEWHLQGDAVIHPQPPRAPSAHISAHAAVQTNETRSREEATGRERRRHQNDIAEAHMAARHAAKHKQTPRRMGPRTEEPIAFWGKDLSASSPAESTLAIACTRGMYASHPGIVEHGPGAVGLLCEEGCGGCWGETVGWG